MPKGRQWIARHMKGSKDLHLEHFETPEKQQAGEPPLAQLATKTNPKTHCFGNSSTNLTPFVSLKLTFVGGTHLCSTG